MPLSQIVSASIEDGAVTPVDLSSVAQYYGFKNRIINGAMVIDQRRAGASTTPTATGDNNYTLDRWTCVPSQASKLSIQQNAASVTPPAGFANYLGVTSLSAYSVLSTDYFNIRQYIEGYNSADLAWGTASAAPITISFWVRSSLTGTFGGSVSNNTANRCYPFSYTISAANTWEQKSITIAGDTSGTWLTTTGIGIRLLFSVGAGSTVSGTEGSWGSTFYQSTTGAVSVVGTNGATFYITGVQLEKGVTATSFDYRPYGTELQLCQRYYEKTYDQSVVPATATTNGLQFGAVVFGSQNANGAIVFKVNKRTAPTMVYYDSAGASGKATYQGAGVWYNAAPVTSLASSETGATFLITGTGLGSAPIYFQYTASAEL